MGVWIGLELNLMSFIPLLIAISSVEEVERGVKYFLVQALGRGFFLLGGFWLYSLGVNFTDFSLNWFCSLLFIVGLLLKLGSFPFHFWVPSVISCLSWLGCLLLSTWQKLAPLFVFFWFFFDSWISYVLFFGVISSLVGGLGGVNQVQIRILIAYSSINHLGWIIVVSIFSIFGFFSYYLVYFIISLFIFLLLSFINFGRVSQFSFRIINKYLLFFFSLMLISLAGLPPFTGFFGKWVVFQEIISQTFVLPLLFLVLGSVFSLYFYLNLFFSVFLSRFSSSVFFGETYYRKIYYLFSFGILVSVFGLGFFEFIYSSF